MNQQHVIQLLLQHLHSGHLVPHEWLLIGFTFIPFIPFAWKLNLYFFVLYLVSHPYIGIFLVIAIVFLYIALRALLLMYTVYVIRKSDPNDWTLLQIVVPSQTTEPTFATEQLLRNIHNLLRQLTGKELFLRHKSTVSIEITSSKEEGIRYMLRVPKQIAPVITRDLRSFLPGATVKEIADYFSSDPVNDTYKTTSFTFRLSQHFAYSLTRHDALSTHDPLSYITNHMTKLKKGEEMTYHVSVTPILSHTHRKVMTESRKILTRVRRGEEITSLLARNRSNYIILTLQWILFPTLKIVQILSWFVLDFFQPQTKSTNLLPQKMKQPLSAFDAAIQEEVVEKLQATLFETTIRVHIVTQHSGELRERASGIVSAFGSIENERQGLQVKGDGIYSLFKRSYFITTVFTTQLQKRMHAMKETLILSSGEVATLFHFPYTPSTQTEDMVKERSITLPAPLALKKESNPLSVIFGKNIFGQEETMIGQTLSERRRHTYVLGATGMGKTTMLKSMILHDITKGEGLCLIDPHGDLSEEVLRSIPENRQNDVIYINPGDSEFPISLNPLQMHTVQSSESEKDLIASNVLSMFEKMTASHHWGPRLEHILRNCLLTALETDNPTLLTVQRLLTDQPYQRKITSILSDPMLKQFWKKEFSLLGDFQKADAISPITNKLGRFLTSTLTRNIMCQSETTFSIDEAMHSGKIVICNLNKGQLGEDKSEFLGIVLITLVQLAAYRRSRVSETRRKDFYLYIDEFQNFATPSFAQLLSEARKYHVFTILSHQTVTQIKERDLTKTILANVGTVICFRTGSPVDEEFILPYFLPVVEKGSIANLAPYHFYMKVVNDTPEDAFSGMTLLPEYVEDYKMREQIIRSTRKIYARPRNDVQEEILESFGKDTLVIKRPVPSIAPKTDKKVHKAAAS